MDENGIVCAGGEKTMGLASNFQVIQTLKCLQGTDDTPLPPAFLRRYVFRGYTFATKKGKGMLVGRQRKWLGRIRLVLFGETMQSAAVDV